MSAFSVAIIGSGTSASGNHIPAYLKYARTHVAAIADADPEKARSVAERFRIKAVYDDYIAMLKKRRPDLVSVCTAPSERKDAVLAALSRGVHVLCDTPTGMSAEEGKAMFEAAEDADRVLLFTAPHRFEAHATTIKQAIVNGDLGNVCLCRAWHRREAIPGDDLWQIKTEYGGGALSVCGCEMLDLSLWLLDDRPVSASGRLFHRFPNSPDIPKTWFGSRRELDAEDLAIALVRCRKCAVTLEVDWLSSANDSGILVEGTKGRGSTSPFRMEVASKGQFVDMTPTFFPETSPWDEQVRCFVEATLGHRKPFPAPEETLLTQRVCDAIRDSSQHGREIPLSET